MPILKKTLTCTLYELWYSLTITIFWLSLAVACLRQILVVTIGGDISTATWSVPYLSRVFRMRPYKPRSCVRVGVAAQEPLVLYGPTSNICLKLKFCFGNEFVSIRVNETKNSKQFFKKLKIQAVSVNIISPDQQSFEFSSLKEKTDF